MSRRAAQPVVAAVALGVTLLSACGAGSATAHRATTTLAGTSETVGGLRTPGSARDLSSLSPQQILAQAVEQLRRVGRGTYQQRLMNGPYAEVTIDGSYDRSADLVNADIGTHPVLGVGHTTTQTLMSLRGRTYVEPVPACYAPVSVTPELVAWNRLWLSRPDDLLLRVTPTRWDAYGVHLDATVPAGLALMLLGVATPTQPAPGLREAAPVRVEVRLGDDGAFERLDIAGVDLLAAAGDLSEVDPAQRRILPHLSARVLDTGVQPSLAVPPASQLRSTGAECGSSGQA